MGSRFAGRKSSWRGIAFSFFCAFSAFHGINLILLYFRKIWDGMSWLWFWFDTFLLEEVCKVKPILTGDTVEPGEVALVIVNHRTRLDWLYMWHFFARQGRFTNEKIVLKAELRSLPIFGWGTQLFGFVFLDRQKSKDEQYIFKCLDVLGEAQYPVQLFIFPEGTDLSPSNLAKSQAWARDNAKPVLEHLLHARPQGFEWMVTRMRKAYPNLKIYDVTLGYPDFVPVAEASLPQGRLPREVHFHLRAYEARQLPQGKELGDWLAARWLEKEELLKNFAVDLRFPGERHQRWATPAHKVEHYKRQAAVFWAVLMPLATYFFFTNIFVTAWTLVTVALCVGITRFGGLDNLIWNYGARQFGVRASAVEIAKE